MEFHVEKGVHIITNSLDGSSPQNICTSQSLYNVTVEYMLCALKMWYCSVWVLFEPVMIIGKYFRT